MIKEMLIWDLAISDTLAFLKYYSELVDRAILIGAASSLDGLGVSFDLMSAVDFFVYFGSAPQPRQPLGPAAGAGAALANWTSDSALFKEQSKCRAELRKLILDTIPNHLLVPMQDANRSLRTRSTEYIITTLRGQLDTLTKADIDFLLGKLRTPYQSGTSVPTFVTNWQAFARDLDRAGQALPQNMAIDYLQKCFGPEFNPCWITFVQKFPQIADRTVARLCTAIITFAKDSLPLLVAHSDIEISAFNAQSALLLKMQARIDQLECHALAANIESCKHLNINKSFKHKVTRNNFKNKKLESTSAVQSAAAKYQAKQLTKDLGIPARSPAWRTKGRMPVLANADSGATGNYLTVEDIGVLRDVCISSHTEQIAVAVANGTLLQSTHHGYLDVPGHGAMIAYIFPQLKGSLLSISQLVNIGLKVMYCADAVVGFDSEDKIIFQGDRDFNTGLWMVDLRTLSTVTTGAAYHTMHQGAAPAVRLDTSADFVNFWHAAYGSPAVSTFLSAIDKGFIRVPGLTSAKVRRHPPNSLATAYGHLHATRKGLKSTKKMPHKVISDDNCEETGKQLD